VLTVLAYQAVHATFNTRAEDTKAIATLGPCIGEMRVEQVDVSGEVT
jgi:hypothetical protein